MSKVTVNCPNCGAPVTYSFRSSVQAVCEYCKSICVRTDVDVKKVGVVGDIPQDASPIQINTEGIWKNLAFVVAGRIVYEYENGSWNEWHLSFNDGSSGWLSDAQLDYTISWPTKVDGKMPDSDKIKVGNQFHWVNLQFEVTSLTKANYKGVEGELPFEYWDKEECLFADLRSATGRFATIDFSEEPPIVFIGDAVDFDTLKLKNLRDFEGWPAL